MTPFDPEFAAPADWARLYREHNVQVVPAFMPGEQAKGLSWKRPLLKTWVEYQTELVPLEVFNPWYGNGGQHVARPNMGMITGTASDNCFVIDLDHHKNASAAAWWDTLMMVHNNSMDLETVEQTTGGGGSQKIYRAPPGWVAPTMKTSIGVDIRGQGGFAMLPPSLHESGNHYEWLDGHGPDEIEVALAPDWLLEAVEKLVLAHGGTTGSNGKTHQPPPATDYDAISGQQVDGRETYMRDLIWAAVLDWSLECPIKPSTDQIHAKMQEKYLVYEREVMPQMVHPIGTNKTDALDAEGRGQKLFHVKWLAAMRHWDDRVYTEARRLDRPKPAEVKQPDSPVIQPVTGPLLLTAEQFIAGFTPPAYLIDGILQRGYLYSLTARTGHGKTAVAMYIAQCIARGEPMHGCTVKQGTVLLLAGENPDDIRARFLVLAEAYGFDPAKLKMRFVAGVVNLATSMPQIRAEAALIDDLVLVIVDTAAAYFTGIDPNANGEQGLYARQLRELTFLPGKPAALVNCHPVKNAARDNLLPMGGSAFLNEVDGNLALWATVEKQISLHWQGKFRGPEFNPISFEITVASSDRVKDAEGRLMPNAVARPISEATLEASEDLQSNDEVRLLNLIHNNHRASMQKLADKMGVKKITVQHISDRLKNDKMVEVFSNRLQLTKKGEKALGDGNT